MKVNFINHWKAARARLHHYEAKPQHHSLYMSLFGIWNSLSFPDKIDIDWPFLMRDSGIGNRGTAVKAIRALEEWGMVEYFPHKSAMVGSKCRLTNFGLSAGQSEQNHIEEVKYPSQEHLSLDGDGQAKIFDPRVTTTPTTTLTKNGSSAGLSLIIYTNSNIIEYKPKTRNFKYLLEVVMFLAKQDEGLFPIIDKKKSQLLSLITRNQKRENRQTREYNAVKDMWFDWFPSQHSGDQPNYTAVEGKSLKSLLQKMRSSKFYKSASTEEAKLEVLKKGFQAILSGWNNLDNIAQKNPRIAYIYQNLDGIKQQLRALRTGTPRESSDSSNAGSSVTDNNKNSFRSGF